MKQTIKKRKCAAVITLASMLTSVMPYAVLADDVTAAAVNITCNVDQKTDVTNVGASAGGYITIDFDSDMDVSTLNETNIIIKNDEGTAVEYEATATARQYKIDKKYLSTVAGDGAVTSLAGDTFTIEVANVKDSNQIEQAAKTFSFTTGTILPVSYKEGYVIENVSVGKTVTELGTHVDGNAIYATDGKYENIGWNILRTKATEKGNAAIKVDLGAQYTIAGVAVSGSRGTTDAYWDRYQWLGGSTDGTKVAMADVNSYVKHNSSIYILKQGELRAKFFEDTNEVAQYLYYGGYFDETKSNADVGVGEIFAWAYIPALNMVESTYPENDATNISNVGKENNTLISVKFNTDMDQTTLNSQNVVIKNSKGEIVDYTPYSVSEREIKIDKKYLSTVKNNGAVTSLDGDSFTVTVAGAKSVEGKVQDAYTFGFTTGLILPVSYKEGYIIDNVALGKNVTELGSSHVSGDEASYVTDGRQFNEWKVLREYVPENNAAFVIDLGAERDLAGVAIAGVSHDWFDRYQIVGGSNSSNLTAMNDTTKYIGSSIDQLYWYQVKAKFFDGASESARYIYAGSSTTCLGCRELYVWAYVKTENLVASTSPANNAVDITNVGNNPTKEIKITFNKDMNKETLNSSNIIIKNGSGELVSYSPKNVTEKEYVLDTKVLANVRNGKAPGKETFTILVGTGVESADGTLCEPFEYKLTTDYIVAPVASVEGKKIVDVAKNKIPEGKYSISGEHLNLTDGNPETYDNYPFTARENQTDNGYNFVLDLDGWYDIAGIVAQASTGRPNNWDNRNTKFYVSAEKAATIPNDAEKIAEIENSGIMSGQVVGKFYEIENSPRYRYIYCESKENSLILSEIYAFAYVDEDETNNTIRLYDYDLDGFETVVENGTFKAVCKADRALNGNEKLITAVYKNGALVNTAVSTGTTEGKLETSSMAVPEEWTTFPNKSDVYELKTFLWDTTNGLKPIIQAKSGIMPNISCWGDSLTQSYTTDGTPWPALLEDMLDGKAKVNNFGFGGETAADTAARFGAAPFVLTENVDVNGRAVEIKFESSLYSTVPGPNKEVDSAESFANGYYSALLKGVEEGTALKCYIGGVEGEIVYESGAYVFDPTDKTVSVTLEKNTPIITEDSIATRDDIQIFMIGANGGFGNTNVRYQLLEKQMVDHISTDVKKYVLIIGPKTHEYGIEQREAMFGDNCLNLYAYFRNAEALSADGVELDEADLANIAEKKIPASLMQNDGVHLNAKGYSLVAKKVYEKLNSLGYIPE